MRKQGTATSPASVGGRGAGRCHPHPADSQENACTAGAKRSRPVSGLTSGARTCLAQRPVFPIHPRKAACCRPRHEPVTACHRPSAGLRRLAGQAWSALTCLPLRGQPRPVPAAQKAFAGSHLVPVSSPWLACGHLLHGCLCRRGIIASALFAEPLAPGARRAKAAPDPATRHGERG